MNYSRILIVIFLCAITWCIIGVFTSCDSQESIVLSLSSPSLQLNVEAKRDSAQLTKLGWDTEGSGRDSINLLKSPVQLYLSKESQVLNPHVTLEINNKQTIQYKFSLPNEKQLTWKIIAGTDELVMQFLSDDNLTTEVDKIELLFHFNSRKAVTSIIGSNWAEDGNFGLPVIVSAPDIGQMLLTCSENKEITGFTEGNRSEGWTKVRIELPVPAKKSICDLKFVPVVLPMPEGYKNEKRWEAARRGWFNFIQQSCGASGGGKEVAGVWANNVLSDPVSSLIHWLGDATLLVPELAPGVTMPPILRRTIDYWIDNKTTDYGMICYTARGIPAAEGDIGDPDIRDTAYVRHSRQGFPRSKYQMVMDANPSIIIGAWSYLKASSDTGWLRLRINDLELISQYMENRDIDKDGLIESRQSGNKSTSGMFNPDMAWDTYMSGHKNAYINALAFRAFTSLADLEKQLGRNEKEQKYRQIAIKIKKSFLKTFYNTKTGWLGWWRSRDGELHDIYSDVPTSLAVSYGIISREEGKEMLQRYWKAFEETGFNRFDLGIPCCIRPVPHYEYIKPYNEFPSYLNGGCTVSNTGITIDALYKVGMTQQADMILDAMLKRQKEGVFPNGGGFQNGFVDKNGLGAEFFDWHGNPTGYEGHLVYSWIFLHAMLQSELTP